MHSAGNAFVPALLKLAGINPRNGGVAAPQHGVDFCLPFDKYAAALRRCLHPSPSVCLYPSLRLLLAV